MTGKIKLNEEGPFVIRVFQIGFLPLFNAAYFREFSETWTATFFTFVQWSKVTISFDESNTIVQVAVERLLKKTFKTISPSFAMEEGQAKFWAALITNPQLLHVIHPESIQEVFKLVRANLRNSVLNVSSLN